MSSDLERVIEDQMAAIDRLREDLRVAEDEIADLQRDIDRLENEYDERKAAVDADVADALAAYCLELVGTSDPSARDLAGHPGLLKLVDAVGL